MFSWNCHLKTCSQCLPLQFTNLSISICKSNMNTCSWIYKDPRFNNQLVYMTSMQYLFVRSRGRTTFWPTTIMVFGFRIRYNLLRFMTKFIWVIRRNCTGGIPYTSSDIRLENPRHLHAIECGSQAYLLGYLFF